MNKESWQPVVLELSASGELRQRLAHLLFELVRQLVEHLRALTTRPLLPGLDVGDELFTQLLETLLKVIVRHDDVLIPRGSTEGEGAVKIP